MARLERTHLERFANLGERHAFRLRSGGPFLGWVLEVGADAVLVLWAPSPFDEPPSGTDDAAPEETWISFDELVPGSLSYWDDQARVWTDFS